MKWFFIIIYSLIIYAFGSYTHEKDMLKGIDRGYIYTWTKGYVYINKKE